MTVTIWHNPRCSKSRQTLALLEDKGIEPEIVKYLETPPSFDDLEKTLSLLGGDISKMSRSNETLFKELALKHAGVNVVLLAMRENPILIERPIVFANGKAAIGRPPESVLDIL